jgi:hypothetical protein
MVSSANAIQCHVSIADASFDHQLRSCPEPNGIPSLRSPLQLSSVRFVAKLQSTASARQTRSTRKETNTKLASGQSFSQWPLYYRNDFPGHIFHIIQLAKHHSPTAPGKKAILASGLNLSAMA